MKLDKFNFIEKVNDLDEVHIATINGGCWDGLCLMGATDSFIKGFSSGWNAAKESWAATYNELTK